MDYEFMPVAKIDNPAPTFDLPAYDPAIDDQIHISLDSLKGRWTVLFYYPADFTFVCPTELKDLGEVKAHLDAMKVEVLAASTDTVFTHKAWLSHEGLMAGFPYKMLADHTGEVAYAYGILDEKSGLAGRGTFIIDPEGIIRGIEVTSGPLGRNSEELVRKLEALQFMAEHPGTACPAKWKKGHKTITPSVKIAGKVDEHMGH